MTLLLRYRVKGNLSERGCEKILREGEWGNCNRTVRGNTERRVWELQKKESEREF